MPVSCKPYAYAYLYLAVETSTTSVGVTSLSIIKIIDIRIMSYEGVSEGITYNVQRRSLRWNPIHSKIVPVLLMHNTRTSTGSIIIMQ